MANGYWDGYWSRRASRRRILGSAGVAAAGLAATGLVGCGDDSTSSNNDVKGLATATTAAGATAIDPFAGAKPGGTYNFVNTTDPTTIDPYGSTSFSAKTTAGYVYSRLFMYKNGPGIKGADVRPTPDLAESAEVTPDNLKWTIKLRKDAKFQNVAPVNGRTLTSDDVKFSWGRATDPKNANQGRLTSIIDKAEFPDASTVVFTLKSPYVAFLDLLADANLLWVMPTESESGFNPAKTMIGSGPWLFDSYTPSVSFKFKKNPNWFWKSGFPLMDAINIPIIPEYATRLAQFQAGGIDYLGANSVDLVTLKQSNKDTQLASEVPQVITFFYFDNDQASPWKDPRVRQAISMGIDRDALMDLAYNVKQLRAGGIDVSAPWNQMIPAGMTRFWLDPQGKDQGDSGQFFKYDVANAKKLMAAAGFADGFSAPYLYPATVYGKAFNDLAEAHLGYFQAIGIKLQTEVQDYPSKYFPQTFAGNFKGIVYGVETPFPEAGGYPQRLYTDNPNNHGHINDANLKDLTAKQALEFNEEKRKAIFWEIQRANDAQMFYVPHPGGSGTTFEAYAKYVMNATTFRPGASYGYATETFPFLWLNK